MSRRRRKTTDVGRIKVFNALIRQVRGKPILEALFRLQDGFCAYDGQPCALLLPAARDLAPHLGISRSYELRFATIDHVMPRYLGGRNTCSNFVMASTLKNGEKGALPPLGEWQPNHKFTVEEVHQMLRTVELSRYALAVQFASENKFTKHAAVTKLVRRELRRIASGSDFKFYDQGLQMVA